MLSMEFNKTFLLKKPKNHRNESYESLSRILEKAKQQHEQSKSRIAKRSLHIGANMEINLFSASFIFYFHTSPAANLPSPLTLKVQSFPFLI